MHGPEAKASHDRPQASHLSLVVMLAEGRGAAGGRLNIFRVGISILYWRACPWPLFCCRVGAAHALVTGAHIPGGQA